MHIPRPSLLPSRGTFVGLLLAATLGLGGMFAFEAVRVSQSHQVSVGHFLDESALAAAREFLTRARDELDAMGTDLLGGLTSQRASSPFESLPATDNLQRAADRAFACGADRARAFRYDLRTDSLVTGAPSSREERTALAARLRADYATRYRPAWKVTLLASGAGTRPVVYGVRFAEFQAPLALYGVELCAAALRRAMFARALERGGLLAADGRGVPPESLLAIGVRDASGADLLVAADVPGAQHRASATIDRLGGIEATVTLRPAATRLLSVSPPSSSRLMLMVGLFVLTALLSMAAVLQLRREAALVRLRTDFTSSVSHELRTPLSQILLFGETLRLDRTRTEAERRLAIDTIVEEGRRLMHLVDNLLLFDRAARGAAPLALGPVRVRDVVTSSCETFAPLADAARMTLQCDVPGGLWVLGDAAALRHVLLNFLDNAAKYGASPQQVRVTATTAPGVVRLAVEDQGAGVPADSRESVWLPFARLDHDRRSARPGSGIGLSVVRDLVARQHGTCWVEDAPHGGARFVVELPAAGEER